MIRIAIIDDHAMVRSALRLMLEQHGSMRIVAETASLQDFCALLPSLECDVVMLDLNIENSQGLVTLERLLQRAPTLTVLVVSAYEAESFAPRAFRAGAKGYLSKNASRDTLLEAIETIVEGKPYPSDLWNIACHATGHTVSLSKREFEILCLIGKGWRNKTIAEHLTIHPKTVSTYRRRMMEKLCLGSYQELYRYAIMHGFADH